MKTLPRFFTPRQAEGSPQLIRGDGPEPGAAALHGGEDAGPDQWGFCLYRQAGRARVVSEGESDMEQGGVMACPHPGLMEPLSDHQAESPAGDQSGILFT